MRHTTRCHTTAKPDLFTTGQVVAFSTITGMLGLTVGVIGQWAMHGGWAGM